MTEKTDPQTNERIVWGLFGLVALMLVAEIVLPANVYVPQPGIVAALATALTTLLLKRDGGGG